MKAALVQAAIPGSTGTQDITDANISLDFKGLISFGGMATANHTAAANGSFSIGFTDGTNSFSMAAVFEDAKTTTVCRTYVDDSFAYAVQTPGASSPGAECAPSAILSNGIRLNWTDIDAAELVNHLLLSGSDLGFKVRAPVLNGTTPVVVAHGLGVRPVAVLAAYAGNTDASQASGRYSVGLWVLEDAIDGTEKYVCVAGINSNGQATTTCVQRTSIIKLAASHNSTSPAHSLSIVSGSADATNISIVADSASTNIVGLALFSGIQVAAGIATLPTGTGSTPLVSGLPSAAKAMLFFLNRNDGALDTSTTSDTAGALGLGALVNNNGTLQQMSACASSDDGASPSDENCQVSNTQAIRILDPTGAPDIEAAGTALTTTATLNFTNVGAAAKVPYLALMDAATTPSFSVAPSVTSQTATAYTLSATPTLNGASSAIWYSVAVRKGTGTPTGAQIVAGLDATDAAALGANSKSITGADTLVVTAIATRPHAVSDLYSVLVSPGGMSAVASNLTEYLDAPSGFGFTVISNLTVPTADKSFITELVPAAAIGDVLQVLSLTEPDGFSRTVAGNGVPVIAAGGVTTWQRLAYDRYDISTWSWDGTDYAYINNTDPTASAPPERLLERNEVPPDNFDLNAYITDPDLGDVRIFAKFSGADIPGMTIASNGLTPGIPTTVGSYIQTIRATDQAGAFVDLSHIVTVEDREPVPNVLGLLPSVAATVLTDAGFVLGNQLLTQDITKPDGVVVSQSPVALTNTIVGSTVDIVINSISNLPPVEIDDITVVYNTGSYTLDVTTIFSENVVLKGLMPSGWSFVNRIFSYTTTRVGTFGPFIFSDTNSSSAEFTVTVTDSLVPEPPSKVTITFETERSTSIEFH